MGRDAIFFSITLLSVLAAAITQIGWTTLTQTYVPTVGASGGVFGVLLGVRPAVSERTADAAVSADPDAGVAVQSPLLRRDGAVPRA